MTTVIKELQSTGHWKESFDYQFFGSHNLKEGVDLLVTIKDVKEAKVFNPQTKGEVNKLTIEFTDSKVPKLILNKTNAKTIENLYGTGIISEWIGKDILLCSVKIRAFGKEQSATRIRDVVPLKNVVDVSSVKKKLDKSTDMESLIAIWKEKLKNTERENAEVIAYKDKLKAKYESS